MCETERSGDPTREKQTRGSEVGQSSRRRSRRNNDSDGDDDDSFWRPLRLLRLHSHTASSDVNCCNRCHQSLRHLPGSDRRFSMSSSSSKLTPASSLTRDEAVAVAEHPQHNPSIPTPPATHSPSYTLAATFASAGLGNAISAACTNPADIVKVRQQLLVDKSRANFVGVAGEMIRKEGIKALWNGVTASCLRELTYSTVRFGLYETFKDFYGKALGVADTSFALKALSGISSGAIGSAFACPTDLIKGETC